MKFFEFIQKALSEDDGKPSSMRLMTFTGFLQWSAAITAGFAVVCIWYENLIIPYLYVVAGLSAAILGLKGWQKSNEQKTEQPEDPKKEAPQ